MDNNSGRFALPVPTTSPPPPPPLPAITTTAADIQPERSTKRRGPLLGARLQYVHWNLSVAGLLLAALGRIAAHCVSGTPAPGLTGRRECVQILPAGASVSPWLASRARRDVPPHLAHIGGPRASVGTGSQRPIAGAHHENTGPRSKRLTLLRPHPNHTPELDTTRPMASRSIATMGMRATGHFHDLAHMQRSSHRRRPRRDCCRRHSLSSTATATSPTLANGSQLFAARPV